jgi:hypothetical protein
MNAVVPMSDNHKECQDCGWRGIAGELDQTDKGSDEELHTFCPECGGLDIKDFSPEN